MESIKVLLLIYKSPESCSAEAAMFAAQALGTDPPPDGPFDVQSQRLEGNHAAPSIRRG